MGLGFKEALISYHSAWSKGQNGGHGRHCGKRSSVELRRINKFNHLSKGLQ
jgi:hypothetical protein